ncbi:MAG: DUF433 domain-containing protein [Pseudomonadota bacterium]
MAHFQPEPWERRLYVPTYRIAEAARFARISPGTVASWHKPKGLKSETLSKRKPRSELTYLQLIEVGVVAAMRESGLTLRRIRRARDYIASEFRSEYPFAEFRFSTDGKELFISSEQILSKADSEKLLSVTEQGQYAWKEILKQRLEEFEYDKGRFVLRWKVAGPENPVTIDPRLAFGAPSVDGLATWVVKERWNSGASINDIASDFELEEAKVIAALKFEEIVPNFERKDLWKN